MFFCVKNAHFCDTRFITAAVIMAYVSYLQVYEGRLGVNHEPEDHLQSSLAAVVHLPEKERIKINILNTQTDQKVYQTKFEVI